MAKPTAEKKTYERPTLERKQKLPEIVKGSRAAVSGVPV